MRRFRFRNELKASETATMPQYHTPLLTPAFPFPSITYIRPACTHRAVLKVGAHLWHHPLKSGPIARTRRRAPVRAPPAGKTAVAANARQHGLSGAFTVLAHEDASEFQSLLDSYRAELKPASADETFLVETMAQSRWNLARARRIEAHLLDQAAGSPVADDPDARIAAEFAARSGTALATVQRYATTSERSYFRARRELLQARSREIRDKANEAQIWYKQEIENLRSPQPAASEPAHSVLPHNQYAPADSHYANQPSPFTPLLHVPLLAERWNVSRTLQRQHISQSFDPGIIQVAA